MSVFPADPDSVEDSVESEPHAESAENAEPEPHAASAERAE